MADIEKIQPIGDSTQYNLKALSLKSQGRVTTANFDAWDSEHKSKITTMLASSSMDSSGTKPPCGDGYLLNFGWDTDAGWGSQLAIQHTITPRVCIRGCNGGTKESTWGNWFWLPTAASSGVGSSTGPIYVNSSGQITACGSSLAVSITGSSASCTGNAASASTVAVTNTAAPSSGTSYYLYHSTGTSGNQTTRVCTDLFLYRNGTSNWLNIGSSGHSGGITIRNVSDTNSGYLDINSKPQSAYHNISFPNASGTVALEGHTHSYLPITYVTSSSDFNNYKTTGLYIIRAGGNTNYATTEGNHGVLFVMWDIGTPFQLFLGDSSYLYFRKRYWSNNAWTAWQTMNAAWA